MSSFEYYNIEKNTSILSKEKSSKFIAYSFLVRSEDDVKTHIEKLWNEHPKATHICYAYRLGTEGTKYRANDDGEPSGSAGKPILSQIDSANVTDCLIAVVRYYGGTKLGVPGLISAYKSASKDCLDASGKVKKEITFLAELRVDILHSNDCMRFLKQNHICILDFNSTEAEAVWKLEIPLQQKEVTLQKFKSVYQWPLNLKIL